MLAMKTANHQRPPNGMANNAHLPTASAANLPTSSNGSTMDWPNGGALAMGQQRLNGLGGGAQNLAMEGTSTSNLTGIPSRLGLSNFGHLTEEDLAGGKLINVEEREEIDPTDGCKTTIWTYHILSADGMEESTITKRRKLKVNCTQSTKRVEYTNGKETKYEEKSVIDNMEALRHPIGGSIMGRPSIEFSDHGEGENANGNADDDSKEISQMLLQTQDNFLKLLREKKDTLVKMFPDLFSNLRTLPAIFELMPSTVMETVVNEDGSTTTRTKSSKQFSSHFTRQEIFINGIRKESKSRFRAFMEYAGPEGGFCIRLNDNPDADLSEDEDASDGRSRISGSGRSEIPDGHSEIAITSGTKPGQLSLMEGKESARRMEKAWHAVNEMVESEERYVQKLALLDKFRMEVERSRLLDRRQMGQLFANIASLHQFHEQHLLPQLMDRRREWQSTKRISDVLRKQGPFLKMYSEFTNNYKLATQMFEECMRKKRGFDEIVKRIEHLPECEHLSLVSHLICPVQRVMRYQLLLKEYQKHLTPNCPDWVDTEMALSLVLEAASHANEMMRKLDRYRNVLEVQEQLGNVISLVSPGRELVTRSRLYKCSSSTGKVEERVLFVFNDLFLLASERSTIIGGMGSAKYKLRALFDAKQTQIYEGDNLELENSFYLRGADSAQGPLRCVELFCNSQAEKNALFDAVWKVIQEANSPANGANSPTNIPNGAAEHQNKSCARCDTDFGWYTRQFACQRCGQRFCKRCIGTKQHKMCLDCIQTSDGVRSKSEGPLATNNLQQMSNNTGRINVLQVPANSEEGIIKASYITFRGPSTKQLQRFFVLRSNFCLYSYRNDKDKMASAMLLLSGCDVGVHQSEKYGITLKQMDRNYLLICLNESDHAEWLAALLLSANAKLPGEKAKEEACGEEGEDSFGQGGPFGGMRKSATIGFSAGRNSIRKPGQQQQEESSSRKPKSSFSLNPLTSLIRRSASMGGEKQMDKEEMAIARERVRELNSRNAAAQQQQQQNKKQIEEQKRNEQMSQNYNDENGVTFRF